MAILRRRAALAVVALALAAAGCGGYHRLCTTPDLGEPAKADVEVTFLGVGGFLIRHGGVAVMTAPLYSNPTIGEVASQATRSDHRLIDALLPPVKDVSAILVGHSHYDHLMDVPYVAARYATEAEIIGNDAMVKLLAPWASLKTRLVSLEKCAYDLEEVKARCSADCPKAGGGWHRVGDRIRVWPILSEHSSQFKIPLLDAGWFPTVHLWRGDLDFPLRDPPLRAGEWVEGTTLAYLIDFLDAKQKVVFRVYYQDSGTRKPFGFPPGCVLKERRVDLALLCVGGSSTLKGHPSQIVNALRPRFTMAGHWEDFLNPRQLPLPESCADPKRPRCERFNEVFGAEVKRFARHLRSTVPTDGQYAVPCPDSVTRFSRDGDGWRIHETTEQWTTGEGRVAEARAGGAACGAE